ncbi:MAG: tryptophan--tRNA ligase [Elusimicrobia bacterium]|nr:tryptophan--tRNA ligase [Elusimicrobiota bacterium]
MTGGPPASPRLVMSGMRPTGRLHLGNYWGALKNWVDLQNRRDGQGRPEYRCHFAVVDWHMLTTGYEDTRLLQENIREMALDWLAAGIDPERCLIFKQSSVPQHAELALLLSMITPLSWLENNPTWKEQLQELSKTKLSRAAEGLAGKSAAAAVAEQEAGEQALRTHGFLGYPVLQAADILLYGGELVPVGQDQLPHVELSREIARRFNAFYGPVLAEPQALLTPTPKIPGVDGRKMSKSYGNAVELLETPRTLASKAMAMYTDPTKLRADDPGHPEPCAENQPGCVVFALHKLYSGYAERRGQECRDGKIGCVACKRDLLGSLEPSFESFRQARERYGREEGLVEEIWVEGSRKAREVAEKTMERVRKAMHLS